MLKNYFKIALRHLFKNRLFSIINILGLTLGFTCFILLSLFVIDELSFDRFHSDSENIYRVIQTINEPDGSSRQIAVVAPLAGSEPHEQFPEVQDQTQLISIGRLTVGNEPLERDYEVIWIADANFFEFFDFEFIDGNPATALTQPDNLVITESIAIKYFGETNVVGRTLFTNQFVGTVAGVIKNFPKNSHIQMDVIHAESTWERLIPSWGEFTSSNWTANSFITYFKMQPGFDKFAFEEKMTALVTQNYGNDINYSSTFELQPLRDIHLYSQHISGGLNANSGNPLYVYMFSIIAFLILAIACFNYMNLSTAAGSRRTQEVAMRKTLGADKKQLILQFTGEALLLSIMSLILAVTLIELTLPYINSFSGKELTLPAGNIPLLCGLLLVVLVSGLLSSLYPSFFLSKVSPATALKREIKIGGSNISLRKVLVVAQFAISIGMIASTIIIYNQLNYMQQKELGFAYNNRLTVDINSGILRSQFESIKQEFASLNEVKAVSVSSRVPGEWKVLPIVNTERMDADVSTQMDFIGADEDFLETYEIELIDGRNLRNSVADSNSVLISEMAVARLGLTDPVGQRLNVPSSIWNGDLDNHTTAYQPVVVGVVNDFHTQSLHHDQRPVMIASYRNPIQNIDYYTLLVETDNWQKTISDIQAINYSFDPENPVEYHFLDTRFAELYEADQTRGLLFLLFAGVIVFIACMGLFALASFAIENRIKEIGVRKVLGAGVGNITWLLSREFTLLVIIAFIVSIPVSYWAIQNWLQEFAHRIPVPWWAFLLAGLIALIIAVGTISYQTVRAALMNPVDTLRSE
ncbi:MAG: FtsX-like permease family protein [Balneolaceae bacterium]